MNTILTEPGHTVYNTGISDKMYGLGAQLILCD
jgi:hypothetical protein